MYQCLFNIFVIYFTISCSYIPNEGRSSVWWKLLFRNKVEILSPAYDQVCNIKTVYILIYLSTRKTGITWAWAWSERCFVSGLLLISQTIKRPERTDLTWSRSLIGCSTCSLAEAGPHTTPNLSVTQTSIYWSDACNKGPLSCHLRDSHSK